MNTCKTCKFWERYAHPSTCGTCEKVDIWGGNTESPNRFQVDVSVSDDSGLSMRLITGFDFGCNQYEGKEVKQP